MENEEVRVSKTSAILIVGTALFFDIVQILLNFLPGPGWIIIWIINALVWLTFFVWFRANGVNFSLSNSKRALSLAGGFIIEMIPVVDILPAWTLATVLTIGSTWVGRSGTDEEDPPAISGKIGPSTSV